MGGLRLLLHRLRPRRPSSAAASRGPPRRLPGSRRDGALPGWLAAFFTLALFATVMSTLDSYLFLSAATVGHDLTTADPPSPEHERRRMRYGLVLSAVLASVGALLFDSAVTVWHHVGSVVTSALLLPVVGVHLPRALAVQRHRSDDGDGRRRRGGAGVDSRRRRTGYPLGVEPMFPALAVFAAVWVIDGSTQRRQRSQRRRAIADEPKDAKIAQDIALSTGDSADQRR